MTNSRVNSYAINVQGLRKSFGSCLALRGIDLNVAKGECISVLGPNGSGKTTLIRILATLSRPSKGQVYIAGFDIRKQSTQIRQQIGVVSHQTFLYEDLSAHENLRFYGKMYAVPNLEKRITEVIDRVELTHLFHNRVGTLSRGMQQRLSIARAILHDPPIMLLDEPETGLDQHATTILRDLLNVSSSGDRTVLMTTHNLALGLALGDRVIILHKGTINHENATQNMEMEDLQETYNRYTGVVS